ncbi:hypothetical protein DKP76_17335 [Falsochrobactrum shanghaiense]|uniref:Uncharacterized protein n=1 Tax=Falsochrobactrum shanghaiense TaxID=2201899 RepID=A0A316J526_9HYPH|nr:hypothetical protein DKP76_17335 [Falsochrobactrum shanghaiense]
MKCLSAKLWDTLNGLASLLWVEFKGITIQTRLSALSTKEATGFYDRPQCYQWLGAGLPDDWFSWRGKTVRCSERICSKHFVMDGGAT